MLKKYTMIYDTLLRRIRRGTYPAEKMIPTERELTEEFDVTRNTIRRAIDELINEGYLYRKPGSGAFVCDRPVARSMERLSVNKDVELRKRYKKMSIHVLSLRIISGTDIQQQILGLRSTAKIYYLQRVQYGDGKPIVYESIYLPCKYFSKLTKDECEVSMSDLVKAHALFDVSRSHYRVVAEAKESTKQTSSFLEVPIQTALLKLKMTVLVNKKPYYYGSAYYPGNAFTFLVEDL